MRLKSSITSNSIKIIDLYNKITSGVWDTSPDFQRKLVWKKQHKYAFINTILENYPFPEIYIASEKIDIEKLKAQEIVVDGKQRVTTIVEYIEAVGDFLNTNKVKPFSELELEEKREFLNYNVTVKDLKDLEIDLIKDIFERINSTDYALNMNERLNARFGDGEFIMFCKQIVDSKFNPTEDETDILIDKETKEIVNNFFFNNQIFTENDKTRMFDVQFIMLVISTILEGNYFSRINLINKYIEKYNGSFELAQNCLNNLLKAIRIITSLKFSQHSYWFNKANLFILLVELSKVNEEDLDIQALEISLLELEKKVDIYFTDEDISLISEDERKYFEYSRQGSNGLTERVHRGNMIGNIISNSLLNNEPLKSSLVQRNMDLIVDKGISYAIIKPTETGLKKSIMDATYKVRVFLKSNQLHDYDNQDFGPDKKIIKEGIFVKVDNSMSTSISLYRANGRGDFRIWFTDLPQFAAPNDELALINRNGIINVLNLTQIDYTDII